MWLLKNLFKKNKNQKKCTQQDTTGSTRIEELNLRTQLNVWLERIAMKLNLKGKKILEVGIAGDEKPSGSYKFFGEGNEWTTLDIDARWKPDIVADITNNDLPDNSFDLVIMTQTIEHIWDYKKALSELYRITRRYAIVDCPFMYPFHEERSWRKWEDWQDYWRFTPAAFKRLLKEAGFKKVNIMFCRQLVLALCEKY